MGKRSQTRITQKIADQAKAEKGDEYIWDAQQTGLGLRVRASGRKTWVYRWRVGRGPGRRQIIAQLGVYRDSAMGERVMSVDEARGETRRWRAAVDEGRDPRSDHAHGKTIAQLWPDFLEHKRQREGIAPRTIEGYELHFGTHISHAKYGIASLPIAAVKRRDVIRLQRAVADQGRVRAEERYEAAVAAEKDEEYLDKLESKLPTAGNGAANSVVLTVSSFFTWLVSSGDLEHNPCEKIAKLPTAGRDPDSILDRDDAIEAIEVIREHATNDGHRDILLLLILTAQRCSDIRERHWGDVILDDTSLPLPYLRVEKHKSRRRTKQAKLVPLGSEALVILLERWPGSPLTPQLSDGGWVVEDELGDGTVWPLLPSSAWAHRLPKVEGPVFPGEDPAKPLTDVWHPWKDIAAHAKRKRVRRSDVHGLRHAGASLLLAAGVPKELIQQLLHHSAGSQVTDRYLHATADVYARLGEILAPGLGRRRL